MKRLIVLTIIILSLTNCSDESKTVSYIEMKVSGELWRSESLEFKSYYNSVLKNTLLSNLTATHKNGSKVVIDFQNAELTPESLEKNFRKSEVSSVELLLFTAKIEDEYIIINWATATELNTKTFELELSTNGVDFSKIASTKASGGSTSRLEYSISLLNNQYYEGGIAYYRLKILDINNGFEYSTFIQLNHLYKIVFIDSYGIEYVGYNGNIKLSEYSSYNRPLVGEFQFEYIDTLGDTISVTEGSIMGIDY